MLHGATAQPEAVNILRMSLHLQEFALEFASLFSDVHEKKKKRESPEAQLNALP